MEPRRVLIVTDAGVDLDDEFALILAAALQREGLIVVPAVMTAMKPTIDRARLVKGTMTELGYGRDLPDILVGMGLSMIEKRNGEPCPTEANCPYLAPVALLHMGDEKFIEVLLDAEPKSITLVLQSGFTDAAALALFHGQLLASRVQEVVVMGGVMSDANGSVLLENGLMVPDDANNNTFNFSAAQIFYTWCQQQGVPMVITTRHAVRQVRAPFSIYNDLASHASPIGNCLRERQYPSIRLLWQRANAPAGSELRGPLPPNRDRDWFVQTFCGGQDPGIGPEDDIVPWLERFMLYDPFNLMMAVPEFRKEFLRAERMTVNGVMHLIAGASPLRHGVRNADALVTILTSLINDALRAASAVHPG